MQVLLCVHVLYRINWQEDMLGIFYARYPLWTSVLLAQDA